MMAWGFLKNRGILKTVLNVVREVAEAASSLADFRKRLAERVAAGDLDDAGKRFMRAEALRDDYVENG